MSQCSKKKNWEMGPWGVRCQDSLSHGSKDNRISRRSTEIREDHLISPSLGSGHKRSACLNSKALGNRATRHAKPWKALSAFVCMFKNVLQHRGWRSRACNVEKLTRSIAMPWYTAPKPKGEAITCSMCWTRIEHAFKEKNWSKSDYTWRWQRSMWHQIVTS